MTTARSLRFALMWSTLAVPGRAQEPPVVARLEPAHLATDVDPDRCRELVITFDQDMDPKAHSLCGGGVSFPTVRKLGWRDARTFVVEVDLAADRVYSTEIACVGSGGFRAKTGGLVRPTPWRFATRGEALADGQAKVATQRLFAAIADHYSYRDRLGIDWAEVERLRHDAMAAAKDGPALVLQVIEMLSLAQDPHIAVRWRDGTLGTWTRPVVANFHQRGLQAVFPKLSRIGKIGLSARTDDGIGYLLVGTFAREQREEFEQVLAALRAMLDCKAIVLDVRTNGGGDEMLARRLAAFFVTGDKEYAGHRVRDPKVPGGFREVEKRTLRGNGEPDVFKHPVAVLMGPTNMSSCEAFLLMMKQAPQAILVGDDSYGSSGNPVPHTLLAGLSVMLPSWQALRADGTMFEGEGIAPHIPVAATPEQLQTDDPVLREALLRLRGQR
jgi:carboxyl-terminal processing protease